MIAVQVGPPCDLGVTFGDSLPSRAGARQVRSMVRSA